MGRLSGLQVKEGTHIYKIKQDERGYHVKEGPRRGGLELWILGNSVMKP